MRRFCLFQRGSTFYVKFWNKDLQKYDTAISTGKRSRNEALAKIQEWIRHGFNGRDGEKTSITDRFNFQSILYYISTVDLNEKQRDRLVDALIDRGIITEQATPVVEQPEESKEEARLLLPFLQEFWDYEKSPYVKEKLVPLSNKVNSSRKMTCISSKIPTLVTTLFFAWIEIKLLRMKG